VLFQPKYYKGEAEDFPLMSRLSHMGFLQVHENIYVVGIFDDTDGLIKKQLGQWQKL